MTGSATSRGIEARLDHLAALGVDVIWLSPIYPSPQDDAGYDISDYQDIDPTFGTLADFDRLLAAVHARGMRLDHGPRRQPHVRRASVVRRVPLRPRPAEARLVLVAAAAAGDAAGQPGRRAEQLGVVLLRARRGSSTRPSGEYYLHLFSRKQPDLNWENPEVREAVYAMMRWWLDRGVDGFRMDVINMISKDTDLPDGAVLGGGPLGDGHPFILNGPRIHEFLAGDAPRGLRGARRRPAERRRDARRDGRGGAALHRPGAARGRHGVPVRARAARRGRHQVGPAAAAPGRPEGLARPLAGGARRRRLEQPLLEQPRPAARGLALRRRRRAPRALGQGARHRAAHAPRDAVRVPGRGARDDQRAVRVDRRTSRTSSRATTTPRRVAARRGSRGRARRAAHQEPRQRAHADAVGRERARRLHHRHALARRSTRTTPRSTRRRSAPTRTPSSTTTGG